jgi:hypothetical protein
MVCTHILALLTCSDLAPSNIESKENASDLAWRKSGRHASEIMGQYGGIIKEFWNYESNAKIRTEDL